MKMARRMDPQLPRRPPLHLEGKQSCAEARMDAAALLAGGAGRAAADEIVVDFVRSIDGIAVVASVALAAEGAAWPRCCWIPLSVPSAEIAASNRVAVVFGFPPSELP